MSKRNSPGHRAGWCIHYTAPPRYVDKDQTWKCDAGIDMEAVWHGVKFAERPCFLDKKGNSKPEARPCPHLRRPTPEEIAADEAWTEQRIDRLRTVMVGIAEWRAKHKGKSRADVVECPACKGRLHLSIAAYNGHVHGKCETDDCVSWME
jgi:hypothetical protein